METRSFGVDGEAPREVIAGIAIVEVPSMEVAIDWADRFGAILGECEVEVRQIAEAPPE